MGHYLSEMEPNWRQIAEERKAKRLEELENKFIKELKTKPIERVLAELEYSLRNY